MSNVVPIRDDDDEPLRIVPDDAEEILAVAPDDLILLDVDEVDAVCTRIETVKLPIWQKVDLVLTLSIRHPTKYVGQTLKMYIPCKPEWKTRRKPLPKTAKIRRMASVALGRPVTSRDRITKALWLNGLFRCEVVPSKSTPPYSIVREFKVRLA